MMSPSSCPMDLVVGARPKQFHAWKECAFACGMCRVARCLCVTQSPSKTVDFISDPWSGWTELRAGADGICPYFGPGHVGIIWLNQRPISRRVSDGVGLSSFEWIGNHYSLIGSRAPEVTEKFWQRLRRWAKKSAVRIPRSGPLDGAHPEIYAFPSALAGFRNGRDRDSNP